MFDVRNLGTKFLGEILTPADPQFPAACRIYNSAIVRRPAAVALCRSENDVRLVVRAARNSGVPVTVRSTGHGIAGRCIADGAVVVDVRHMDHVHVEPAAITVGGGATWRQVDAASQRAGLAVTGGTVSSTGVAGLTLGGGIGWLLPSFGLACDSLLSARIVTGDGSIIDADDELTPDLMWALRGSGHGLGVVTEFRFRPHRLRPVLAGSWMVELDRLGPWLTVITDLLCEPMPGMMVGPSFLVRDGRRVLSLDIALHGPTPEHCARIEGLRRMPGIVADTVRWRSYVSLQTMIDNPSRSGLRSYWRAGYPATVTGELVGALAEQFRLSPSPHTILFLENLHGAFARPELPNSFPTREPRFSALLSGSWREPEADDLNMSWIESTWAVVAPHLRAQTSYVNYSSDPMHSGPENALERLRRLASQVDPDGVFASEFFAG